MEPTCDRLCRRILGIPRSDYKFNKRNIFLFVCFVDLYRMAMISKELLIVALVMNVCDTWIRLERGVGMVPTNDL